MTVAQITRPARAPTRSPCLASGSVSICTLRRASRSLRGRGTGTGTPRRQRRGAIDRLRV
jgi:hypothetical protein